MCSAHRLNYELSQRALPNFQSNIFNNRPHPRRSCIRTMPPPPICQVPPVHYGPVLFSYPRLLKSQYNISYLLRYLQRSHPLTISQSCLERRKKNEFFPQLLQRTTKKNCGRSPKKATAKRHEYFSLSLFRCDEAPL